MQGQPLHGTLQIDGQRHAHAHGKHTGLLQCKIFHGGHIACGKHARVGNALQRVLQADAMARVQRQARALQPSTTACLRDPEHLVGSKPAALGGAQAARLYFGNGGVLVHVYAALRQHARKALANASVVGGQQLFGGEQVELQSFGIPPRCLQHGTQPVLHGQAQLHAARTPAHNGNVQQALVVFGPCQQCQPALLKAGDGFDGHRMGCGPDHLHLGRGAGVDGD